MSLRQRHRSKEAGCTLSCIPHQPPHDSTSKKELHLDRYSRLHIETLLHLIRIDVANSINRPLKMYTALVSLLATTAIAAPTGKIFGRQEDCSFFPQNNQASSTFILRVEPAATNATLSNSTVSTNGTLNNTNSTSNTTTLGYLDAFSTSHALLAPSRRYASEAFNAPNWNTNQKLIFWDGDQGYERGFNIDQDALSSDSDVAAVVSTPGCGTPFVDLRSKYVERGECGLAGQKVRAQTGCPAWGTTNSGDAECTEQRFFVCDNTGLQGISDEQRAIFYGVAASAVAGENCQEVDLVTECP